MTTEQLAVLDTTTITPGRYPRPVVLPAMDGGLFTIPKAPSRKQAPGAAFGLTLDLNVTQPDPSWLDRAACGNVQPGGLDPTLLTEDARTEARRRGGRYIVEHRARVVARWYRQDVAAAKRQCLACPVMRECRTSAVHVDDVPGIAGAWTEAQRAEHRARWGIPTPGVDLDDVDPAGLTPNVLNLIRDLTDQGLTASQVAARIDSPEIDDTTVEYARQIIAGTKRPKWVAA